MAFFGGLQDILFQWESLGVFDFLLPFLLIFAVVFGILSSTRWLGDNNGVYVIIATVIGLISLRYQYFLSEFLSELFPRLGIGVAILLVLLILIGIFVSEDETRYWGWGLGALGGVIAIIVIWQTFDRLGYHTTFFGTDTAGLIILAVLLIGIIIAIGASGKRGPGDKSKGRSVLLPWRDFLSGKETK
ncbi:MAG: hypothetical protein AABX73_01985 [Nanoarchaeota archaeon]